MKIYYAISYTGHENESFLHANKIAGKLINQGHIVFSPISHTHPIACQCSLPTGWEFWKPFDYTFIQWCDAIYISSFGDWKKSKGVQDEIKMGTALGKLIYFMSPEEES